MANDQSESAKGDTAYRAPQDTHTKWLENGFLHRGRPACPQRQQVSFKMRFSGAIIPIQSQDVILAANFPLVSSRFWVSSALKRPGKHRIVVAVPVVSGTAGVGLRPAAHGSSDDRR